MIRIFFCRSGEDPVCPCCGGKLRYRDRRQRVCKSYGGRKVWILIRRLKCSKCSKLHEELPDMLVPYKHYKAEVIENVIDEVCTPDDLETEDYPCEKTMGRWKRWITCNIDQIDGILKSVGHRYFEMSESLLRSKYSLLQELRRQGNGWLSICVRVILNSGGSLLSAFGDGASAPALSCCQGSP